MPETTTSTDKLWLVWSNQHGAWWRDGGRGYTTRLDEAGRFTEAEADKCCVSRSKEASKPNPEIKVYAPEYERMRTANPIEAVRLRHGYSGADWLGYSKKIAVSEFGGKVAEILGYVWRGIYHMDQKALEKVDWSNTSYIKVRLHRGHEVATFDGRELTELVVLCHDFCIRLGITAEFGGFLMLHFSQRQGRTGSGMERHPTIEESVERVRKVEE